MSQPIRLLVTISALALAAAGCRGGSSASGGAPAGRPALVTLDGSSTVFPISEAVAEEFQKATPGVRVTVGISGTGGGFKKFCGGETDISDASRPITAGEAEACAKIGVEYVELPIAYDGIAIAVNPKAQTRSTPPSRPSTRLPSGIRRKRRRRCRPYSTG